MQFLKRYKVPLNLIEVMELSDFQKFLQSYLKTLQVIINTSRNPNMHFFQDSFCESASRRRITEGAPNCLVVALFIEFHEEEIADVSLEYVQSCENLHLLRSYLQPKFLSMFSACKTKLMTLHIQVLHILIAIGRKPRVHHMKRMEILSMESPNECNFWRAQFSEFASSILSFTLLLSVEMEKLLLRWRNFIWNGSTTIQALKLECTTLTCCFARFVLLHTPAMSEGWIYTLQLTASFQSKTGFQSLTELFMRRTKTSKAFHKTRRSRHKGKFVNLGWMFSSSQFLSEM